MWSNLLGLWSLALRLGLVVLGIELTAFIILILKCLSSLSILESQSEGLLLGILSRIINSTPSPAAIGSGIWNELNIWVDLVIHAELESLLLTEEDTN